MSQATLPTRPVENWEQVRDRWLEDIDALYDQIDEWAEHQGWATLRDQKTITEDRIGQYQAQVLLIHTLQGRLLLEPIRRFVVAAEGLINLNLYPSFDSITSLIRKNGGWRFKDILKGDLDLPWTEESFVQLAKKTLEMP